MRDVLGAAAHCGARQQQEQSRSFGLDGNATVRVRQHGGHRPVGLGKFEDQLPGPLPGAGGRGLKAPLAGIGIEMRHLFAGVAQLALGCGPGARGTRRLWKSWSPDPRFGVHEGEPCPRQAARAALRMQGMFPIRRHIRDGVLPRPIRL